VTAGIDSDRRYTKDRRCPICGGAPSDPRGAERRCFGFLSRDGDYAHCSREEHAGAIKLSDHSNTYGHRLHGPCACGTMHSDGAPPRAEQPKQIVATYDYHDEDGQLLYQVVRFTPKEFRQRRPDPESPDRWIWKLGDVRRVLYHLDRLAEADRERTVYIVEGEKDVHALEELGLVATTNPQGAGKWPAVVDCAARALAGRNVIVIADADKKGRDHAADVLERLSGVAEQARIIELPGAKDAADWVRSGGTAEQLEALAAALPTPIPAAELSLSRDFERDEDGKIYHSQANIKLALRKLGVRIRYNMFARRRVVDGLPGFGPRLDDDALNHLRLRIDAEFRFRLGKEFYYDVIVDHGHEQRYHPVRDYLDALRWDGRPRLDGWLTSYGGAEDNAYTRAIGTIVLTAAVRRVRQPGCKFDEMLILESGQGKNKSTALSVLAVDDDWFTDDLPLGEDTRKMIEQTTGRWIVEAGELRGMNKSDVHTLRQYLGRTKDTSRLAYGKESTEVPRQFVIIGTMNPTSNGYLKDTSGNRRFWPVLVEEFNLDRLREDRDQLWAEAAHREASGASIRLDPALYEAAGDAQEQRRTEDPFEIIVHRAFGELTGRIRIEDAWKVLGIQGRVISQDEMTRFGTAMRMQGWERKRGRNNGEMTYVYFKGQKDETRRWLTVQGTSVQ
jgi:predicted P-loop ATPase